MNHIPAKKNKPNSNPNKPCPELAEALSAAEGAVEWANFTYPQESLPCLPSDLSVVASAKTEAGSFVAGSLVALAKEDGEEG